MRKLLLVLFGFAFFAESAFAISCEELRQKYVPQSDPEATYRMELEMMSGGIYCYDLPIFDPQWRAKGGQVMTSAAFQQSARKWGSGFKAYVEGDRAIIFYPGDRSAGPVFLYKEPSGWILDRTCVINNIHYSPDNTCWIAYEGGYPYLDLLKKVFTLKKGSAGGHSAYQLN